MLKLLSTSDPRWLECVLADFDTFLIDHAACEKKASGMALRLATHYRDKPELVRGMVDLAVEELTHFEQVYTLLEARGLLLGKPQRDPYIRKLTAHLRSGSRPLMLDRLLLFGIVEARGCERFGLVADALEPSDLKTFYEDITRSEARHHGLFTRLAKRYFPADEVQARLQELLAVESEILAALEIRPHLH